ncbi:hypothetical protein BN946_scf184989.g57 [Trametes cinnabarina]|uniref:U3 small nucleolar RNA-associated protein 10 n=1 Tax=Pycnoporus cinnabarinus TaxID=5643 RepID=A0A060S3T2_PYCCI|nr:hypothetical protein BN946_scf184989.g57 [Trametes cinnabarina]
MVSSLAEQLAKSVSLNANLLNEKARKQTQSESYLFAPKEARQHDIESLHAVGANGFLQLKALQPAVAPFEQSLFSDAAKSLDRTLQPAEQNAKLDATISAFLPLLGPFLLDSPTGKVLEWLVRRFRIHEFNVDAVVSLFMPYHETPHFVKMVSILHIQDRSIIRFLQAYKTTAKALHRNMLINEMVKSLEFARFVTSILPAVLSHHSAGMHRALIAFHTGVLLEYIAASRTLDENTMAVLLPAVLEPLQTASKAETKTKPALLQETILGSYLALAAISQKTNLTTKAVASILVAVTDCAARVSPKQLIRTLVSITAPQDQLERVPKSVIEAILAIPHVESELIDAVAWVGAEKLLVPLLNHLFAHLGDYLIEDTVEAFITSQSLPGTLARSAALTIIRELVNGGETPSSMPALRRVLSHLYQRHPKAVEAASSAIIADDKDKADAVEQLVLSLSISSISSTLLLRVHDSDASVLKALYTSNPQTAVRVLLTPTPTAYLDALVQALHGSSAKPSRDVIRAHFSFLLSHFLPALAAQEEDAQKLRELTRRIAVDIILPFLLYTKPRMKTAQTIWGILEAAEDQGLNPAMFELLGGCVEAVRWEQQRPSAGAKDKDGNKNNMDVPLMTKINIAVAAKIAGK